MLKTTAESELKKEVKEAISQFNLSAYELKDSQEILSKISNMYVDGDPRAWWLSLKHVALRRCYENNKGYLDVPDIVKGLKGGKERLIFIVDDDNRALHVYSIELSEFIQIIESCRYFEYYLTASSYSWLIAENDHGDILVCERPSDSLE
ncbi:hypothetical protein NK8_58210 (plasmid) [Caballeronia sp. NK8]|uniref:DUF6756 family protein n=1 Tax=Caballeronia sp. NK8 TaxID=140098 RepID=UPI001BB589EB|nr:DUF6756 family protein [Caballeronia sp. NK8]BCQ27632.1 hypothetical protein NK8_58210 [Caballeronia sp. NK8]